MLPDPLHPAIVHFPIVLAALLPISALVALWTIRRGVRPLHGWAVPVVLAIVLTGSAWAAIQTGEDEEEAVERVVGEEPLHEHEEAAERFLLLAGITTLVLAGGLASGTVGLAARLVGTAASFVVLLAGVQTGDLGGELVWVHGAASAYIDGADGPAGLAGETLQPSDSESDEPAGASTRGASTAPTLPGLFTLMAGLERDAGRLGAGLWSEDFDTIAAAAASIAGHPTVPETEAARIAEVLGPDMARFKAWDTRVHDRATRIGELAEEGDLEAILAAEVEMRAGCVGCHTEFRERLRTGLR